LAPNIQTLDQEEDIQEKLKKASDKMKLKAEARKRRRRRGNAIWEPVVNEQVLVKTQPVSDAARGLTAKFMHIYEGPFMIGKSVGHDTYQIREESGKVRGEFNKRQLKPYRQEE
jgi:hypothetical protein